VAVYAIGDVQGCFDALRVLLDKLRFEPASDVLWFTGDLVNRGPQSLDVLRFVASLPNAKTVLGNHDLHLLAVASGHAPRKKNDSFEDVLEAPDRESLLSWLRLQPLLIEDSQLGFAMVHAGLLPEWDMPKARQLTREAEAAISASSHNDLFVHMYGDTPDHWQDELTGWERLRVIINACTRMRYCDRHGHIDLRAKGHPKEQPNLLPWFQVPGRRSMTSRIIFGHWSALGLWNADGVLGLDSGCVWGGKLTAVRLDTDQLDFNAVTCTQRLVPSQ